MICGGSANLELAVIANSTMLMKRGKGPHCCSSVLPEAVEAAGVHLGVAPGVGHLTMPEIGGQRPGIDTLIDKLEAAAMAQKVRMDPIHANALGGAAEHFEEAVRGHWRPALGHEHIPRSGPLLSPDSSQGTDFAPAERLYA